MTIRIGSNIQALSAIRQLNHTSNNLATTYERLSSGQRINKASDDAAGLAIANELKVDQRVATVAIRNINDAISAVNLTNSAINQQKEVLFRLGELAEQSANGVYSAEQRKALDNEYQALIKEFDRIAVTTEFNGEKLLNENKSLTFQIGGDSSKNSQLSLNTESSRALAGVVGLKSSFDDDPDVDGADLAELFKIIGNLTDASLATSHTEIQTSVVDSQGQKRELQIYALSVYGNLGAHTFNTDSIDILLNKNDGSWDSEIIFDFRNDIFSKLLTFDDTGATAEVVIDFRQTQFENLDYQQEVRKSSIAFTNTRTSANSLDALDTVNNRIEDLSALEGKFGAISQRLLIASENMSVRRENIAAAESQIRDADIAFESSELIRNNILQQAGISVLSQANQQPALALQLL